MIAPIKQKLTEQWKFSLHGLPYQGLLRPHLATKIIFDRIKYGITKKTTLTTTKLFFDERMTLKLPEEVSETLFIHHFFEYGLSNFLLSYLQPNMVFVDVGAHFGYFTLLASKILSNKGMVHSFEPIKNTYELLCKNTRNKDKVITNQVAVWSKNCGLEFHDYGEKLSAYNSFTRLRKKNFRDR